MGDLSAGEVPQSDELASVLRLRRALLERFPGDREELSPAAHVVSLTFLESIEASRRVTLPYDIITLATLRIPVFVRAVGLQVADLGDVVRDCAGDFHPPNGWVAVASFGKEAMSKDVPYVARGHDTLLAVSKKATARTGDPDVRTLDGPGPSTLEKLSTVLRDRIAKRYRSSSQRWADALAAARGDTRDDECVVRIVDDHPPPPGPAVRVVHPKFGEGRIVRELEDDKLEIAFDTVGNKTLQRRFVREL